MGSTYTETPFRPHHVSNARCHREVEDIFPDPSNSPARYAHTLVVGYLNAVTTADAAEGSWIQSLSRVVRFAVDDLSEPITSDWGTNLAPFHKLLLTLKSLSLTLFCLPISGAFNLIHSFPFLENLTLIADEAHINDDGSDGPPTVAPSTPPALTGTLQLCVGPGTAHVARRLLDLPGGLHFKGLT